VAAETPATDHVRRWHEPDESVAFGGVTEELTSWRCSWRATTPSVDHTGAELIVDGGETII
jgi:hypothetical protein